MILIFRNESETIMIKEIKREENTKLFVAKRDDNDLYIECIEHKKGEHFRPIAIYFYSAKTILKK